MKWWLLTPLFLFSVSPVFAASIAISNFPGTIDQSQEFSVDTLLNCSGCTTDSYLRGVFFPTGTSYFGLTQNNKGDWVGTSSDKTEYWLVAKNDLISSTWSGQLQFKPDSSDPLYSGPGEYQFKVIRYTPGGSKSAESESVAINITGPTPEPSPSPTPTITPTPTPNPTPSSTLSDYSNLFISEYLPYPDSGNEWIEIYNGNDSEVNLNGWFIDDVADSGSAPIDISGTIGGKIHKQFYLSDSFFNNNGDDVRLLNSSKTEKSKTSFSASTKAKSWSKDSVGNWCQTESTPNSENSSCPTPNPTPATHSPTPSISPIAFPTLESRGGTEGGDIKETPSSQILGESTSKSNILSYILIGVGLVLILISVGLVVVGQRSGKLIFHEEN